MPCVNCHNLVHIDQIDDHSNKCQKVKDDVIAAETSKYSCHSIDFKLKKLQQNIVFIKDMEMSQINSDINKEMHYISLLLKYIQDASKISKIDNKSVVELKKISLNIDVN